MFSVAITKYLMLSNVHKEEIYLVNIQEGRKSKVELSY